MKTTLPIVLGGLLAGGCACTGLEYGSTCSAATGADPAPAVPVTRTVDQTDTYFGTVVHDPYRWLENEDGAETVEWIKAENAVTLPYLERLPGRQPMIDRITKLWDYEKFGTPFEEGGRYFYTRNDGLQNQSVLYVAESLDAEPRILIDPNTFSEDGTLALSGRSVSPDGKLIAYSIADAGSDWDDWYVMSVDTGEKLADHIGGMKFSGVSWDRDSSGFYYSRYPEGDTEQGYDDQKTISVYHHTIGDDQENDKLVVDLGHETRNPYGTVTEDGRYLVVNIWDGYIINGVSYIDLKSGDGKLVPLINHWDPDDPLAARYGFLGNDGSTFFFQTTLDAPNQRIIAIDADNPAPEAWREIIPEAPEAMDGVSYIGGRLVVQYIKDASSTVSIFAADGAHQRDVELPGLGSVGGFGGHEDSTETFYSFTGFTDPGAIYRYDVATGVSTLFRRPKVDFDPNRFTSEQIFYTSKDGTRVPMFIVHKKGIKLNGDNPVLLYGYGGFDVSLTPWFSVSRLAFMERGGVWALANIRGGGEYGEAWHLAGTKLNKQNVFDDFIAGGEWLIDNKYTSPERLAIMGGSNGGLLIGACITQRPELYAAAVPEVGVLDMLRYHTASANAKQWSTDYGLSSNEEEFKALYAYSPYHNTHKGTCYPPTLITTARGDDRVAPWNSYKFAAALQAAQGCDNPVLIRVETRAGHGAGKPTWMIIEEVAEKYAFVMHYVGMD